MVTSPRPDAQARRRAATRERIVLAGNRLFEARGYDDVSLADIATEAGTAARTIYLHFDSKAAILLAYFDDWIDRYVAALCEGPPDEGLEAAMRRAFESLDATGLVDHRAIEQMDAPHPVLELLTSVSLDVRGHVLQTWISAQDTLAEHFRRSLELPVESIVPRVRAAAVFAAWMTTLLAYGDARRRAPARSGPLHEVALEAAHLLSHGVDDDTSSTTWLRLSAGMRWGEVMTDPTPDAWRAADAYLAATLVDEDADLTRAVAEQAAAGMPAIEVAPLNGKLLHLLARIAGARRVLEVGTLGGYSTIWLARAIPDGGVVVTIEAEQHHADVARRNVDRAGVGARVDIRVGRGVDVLPTLADESSFDLVFIDADKESNTLYLDWAARLGHPGTVVVVDNIGRAGAIADPTSTDPRVTGAQRGLAMLGTDPRFDATALQTLDAKGWDGVAIAVLTDAVTT